MGNNKNKEYKKGDLVWVNINPNNNTHDINHYEGPAVVVIAYDHHQHFIASIKFQNKSTDVYPCEIEVIKK
jgi:ribosomal protein L21E